MEPYRDYKSRMKGMALGTPLVLLLCYWFYPATFLTAVAVLVGWWSVVAFLPPPDHS